MQSILDKYFDETTMSVHLIQDEYPLAKKGKPGVWDMMAISDNKLSEDQMKGMYEALLIEAETFKNSFVEIKRTSSYVLQIGNYRVVIVHPPVSDKYEITIVRPLVALDISDYNISEEVLSDIENGDEGILIAGAPGNGKSTFAAAIANHLHHKFKIVKTVESPRDLQVEDGVVQYSNVRGSADEIRDILLLSRPDYTFYDEIRNKDDFFLYKDMRLTGIGMVGVIHGTKPIDAIQRFIGQVELGVLPQIITKVVFIEKGDVAKIFTLEYVVKVPAGMVESDLARPVVVVKDNSEIVYEIYSFGEEVVVMPTDQVQIATKEFSPVFEYAVKEISKKIDKELKGVNFKVEVSSLTTIKLYVAERDKGRVIGKKGSTINRLEEKIGLRIDVIEK